MTNRIARQLPDGEIPPPTFSTEYTCRARRWQLVHPVTQSAGTAEPLFVHLCVGDNAPANIAIPFPGTFRHISSLIHACDNIICSYFQTIQQYLDSYSWQISTPHLIFCDRIYSATLHTLFFATEYILQHPHTLSPTHSFLSITTSNHWEYFFILCIQCHLDSNSTGENSRGVFKANSSSSLVRRFRSYIIFRIRSIQRLHLVVTLPLQK